ncbi:type II and III secretion system protein family protein [Sneathiella aquimaris]|uniref:type II and III secretion system protein family protein n=1 Tax=Sneathiella aquimaris TaxID=2599305 RepID=UPI00146EDB87|nr:type II and III secretion system protein family protein [Sneathiella aquimaris]
MRMRLLLTIFLFFSCMVGVQARPTLYLNVNEGHLQKPNQPVQDILITNPEIADVQITQGNGLFIYGKIPGVTHIVALGAGDKILFDRIIEVQRDLGRLRAVLKAEFPNENIAVSVSPGSLMMSGEVSDPQIMDQMLSVVKGYLGKEETLINKMTLASALQVNLKVRIMEMNRRATKDLGINWDILLKPGSFAIGLVAGRNPLTLNDSILPKLGLSGQGSSGLIGLDGSSGSLNAVIDAMVEDNLVTVLAEPNLTSRSGKTASFFAGGEFPIPVAASNDRITVEFKKFGVILDMTPTVLSNNRIRLHIRPEVSELSTAGAVVIQDITVPGISIRRTEATIELASGQSFSVAGLLQNQQRNLVSEVPWLADIDVLGALFRSQKFQKSETELVMIATAHIVRPRDTDDFRSPLEGLNLSSPDVIQKTGKLLNEQSPATLKQLNTPSGNSPPKTHGYIY